MVNYKSLVEQTVKGSTESAYALFLSTFRQVYYSALKKTQNDSETEKLVRDAYIMAIKNIGRLEYPEQFPVWVQSLANMVTDYYLETRGSFTPLETGCVSNGPWSQKECDELNLSEAFAMKLWADIVCGINGNPRSPEESKEAGKEDSLSNIDNSEIENILAKMSLLRAKIRRRDKIIAVAAVLALTLIIGVLSYNYNQKKRYRHYSALAQVYSSPEAEKVNEIASAISGELAGEVGEIYELSENTYYVVIYLNNRAAGGAIVSYVETNEGNPYNVVSKSDKNLSEDDVNSLLEDPYLRLNYSPSLSDDTAIEDAINSAAETELEARDNQIGLDKNNLLDAALSGNAEKDKLGGIFGLSEDVNVMLSVRCRHVDLTKPVKITIDKSVEEMIGKAGYLQIILNDNRHCIRFTSDQIKELCKQYGTVSIKLQAENNRIYNISFWGPNGKEAEALFGDVVFILPADSESSYVYANYSGGNTYAEGSENRGGSFDPVEKTISFSVSHSGRYELMGTDTALFDVDGLDEETRKACEFVAAMGFIPAGEDGNYKPYKDLTRGEFVKALGRMFFTTDKTQQAGFKDIDTDDELYEYIAAGHAENVVLGVAGDNFGGNNIITVEELLTMAGKTMVLKDDGKNVSSINDAAVKFSIPLIFADSKDLSWFAVDPVKTLILFDILPLEGRLQPQNPASRSYAALILHRMYKQVYQ